MKDFLVLEFAVYRVSGSGSQMQTTDECHDDVFWI